MATSNDDIRTIAASTARSIRLLSKQRKNERVQPDALRARIWNETRRFRTVYLDTSLHDFARDEQIPVEALHDDASARADRAERVAAGSSSDASSSPPWSYSEHLMAALLDWYKGSYMRWVNNLPCESCNCTDTVSAGSGVPTAIELAGGAGRVELYTCRMCNAVSRFPRYNDLRVLMKQRRGRCGEWANLFTLFSIAMGFETRYVLDYTDHVWCEFWSDSWYRWVHVDPSEGSGSLDQPLLYEAGWGKKLTYVFAFDEWGVTDVIRRYTRKVDEVLKRRTLARESVLQNWIMEVNLQIRSEVSTSTLLAQIERRAETELVELMNPPSRPLRESEKIGRKSGNLEWRLARGETTTIIAAPPIDAGNKKFAALAEEVDRFILLGSTRLLDDKSIELTPSKCDQRGAFWIELPPSVEYQIITVRFAFRIVEGSGADGLALVLQSFGPNSLGAGGCGLGYAGIARSVAVEFDMYASVDSCADPDGNHVSVQTRGRDENSAHHAWSRGCTSDVMDMSKGDEVRVVIVFDKKVGGVDVFMGDDSGDGREQFVLHADVNLHDAVFDGSGGVWIGMTAATGGLCQSHKVIFASVSAVSQTQHPLNTHDSRPLLPEEWEALGPFAIGARELGVDPLSAYGGFETIPFSDVDRYPSELADEGFVRWFKIPTNKDQTVGPISYSNVRWEFNQGPFGWTSLHHATYFRGKFNVTNSGIYIVNFDHVVSFKIDDKAYVGNVYGYKHASGTPIYLEQGEHIIFVCAVMDVRLFGGQVPPQVLFTGKFQPVDQNTPSRNILVLDEDAIVPELLDEKLITPFFSITVMNSFVDESGATSSQHAQSHDFFNASPIVDEFGFPSLGFQEESGSGWVQILSVYAISADGSKVKANIPVLFSLKLAPGQVYPIAVDVDFDEVEDCDLSSILFEIEFYDLNSRERFIVQSSRYHLRKRVWGDPYKVTFVDYDNIVHYGWRVLLLGMPIVPAGVEAESSFWIDSFKRQDYAWDERAGKLDAILEIPNSQAHFRRGFDWHGPSNLNVESAIHTLTHLHGVPDDELDNVRINPNKLVYSGHSNGGQAVPASGYMKIQFYTPYYMRIGDAYTDPTFRAIMESSIAENDIDMYAANMVTAGIPIMARTGGADDNVPPLNTRRMSLSEVRGQGHWFAGIMDDDELNDFLSQYLDPERNPGILFPPLQTAFTISTLNPASTGSKGGIKILQLEVPFRLARIRVHIYGTRWVLNTSNVRRFGFLKDERAKITSWEVDGMVFNEPPKIGPSYLRIEGETEWKPVPDLLWISEERYWSTYGPASQILNHPFLIVVPSNPTTISLETYHRNARLIATSWYLYGRGGTQIMRDIDVRDGVAAKYHLIVLGGPQDNLFTRRREKEGGNDGSKKLVRFLESGGYQIDSRKYEAKGTGMIFLAPSPTRTLMGMYITGIDEIGFKRAVWTIPFRTGLMVPDYLVVGDEYGDPATGWTAGEGNPYGGGGTKGSGGIFAAGVTYNGHLHSCDNWMNINLQEVICTSADGDKFWRLPEVYIRGMTIKYLRLPDEIIDFVREDREFRERREAMSGNGGGGGGGRGGRGGGGGARGGHRGGRGGSGAGRGGRGGFNK
ncbi:hypothetical protein HDU84_008182 [Entophlyctis sp. JEL0112]|nr:hypothetical protein HDU84_008182 [Entophlyctis sp. JEL0112]